MSGISIDMGFTKRIKSKQGKKLGFKQSQFSVLIYLQKQKAM